MLSSAMKMMRTYKMRMTHAFAFPHDDPGASARKLCRMVPEFIESLADVRCHRWMFAIAAFTKNALHFLRNELLAGRLALPNEVCW